MKKATHTTLMKIGLAELCQSSKMAFEKFGFYRDHSIEALGQL